ncbi:MAG TPA: hypothetical protein VII30_05315 [Gemmatimonadaceae bacterium]
MEGDVLKCLRLDIQPRRTRNCSVLKVRIQTHHQADLISSEQAAAEIENAGAGVAEIGARSQEFAGLMAVRPILYELFDDYGMGALRLAFKAETGFHFVRAGTASKMSRKGSAMRWRGSGSERCVKPE